MLWDYDLFQSRAVSYSSFYPYRQSIEWTHGRCAAVRCSQAGFAPVSGDGRTHSKLEVGPLQRDSGTTPGSVGKGRAEEQRSRGMQETKGQKKSSSDA